MGKKIRDSPEIGVKEKSSQNVSRKKMLKGNPNVRNVVERNVDEPLGKGKFFPQEMVWP